MRLILFNLAPYRARKEKLKKIAFYVQMAFVLAVSLIFCYAVSNELESRAVAKESYLNEISSIEQNIELQANQVSVLEQKLTVLRRQVETLRSIEQDTLLSSQLLAVLDQSLPAGMALAKVTVSPSVVSVYGRTNSVSTLAQWTEFLKKFPKVYSNSELIRLAMVDPGQAGTKGLLHDFEIKLTVSAPSLNLSPTAEAAK